MSCERLIMTAVTLNLWPPERVSGWMDSVTRHVWLLATTVSIFMYVTDVRCSECASILPRGRRATQRGAGRTRRYGHIARGQMRAPLPAYPTLTPQFWNTSTLPNPPAMLEHLHSCHPPAVLHLL
eukprot:362632-Chlamydomonas_euryale.AAC.6